MGIYIVQMKTHNRVDITNQFDNLNDCIIHHEKPKVMELTVCKSKDAFYVITCKHNDCTRMADDKLQVEDVWNKYNPGDINWAKLK
jgi:hypothetical protein